MTRGCVQWRRLLVAMRWARFVALGSLVAVAAASVPTLTSAASPSVSAPAVVASPVPFGAARRAETAAYAERHYGLRTWRLTEPRVLVQHYTASTTFKSAFATFASNSRDQEYGETPGVCAHYVIDIDGTIHQLVPVTFMCRHTVGLNWTAIGIEHVGTSDASILTNRRQMAASVRLSLWLMHRHRIALRDVIGHSESLASPFYRERVASFRCRTHGDWNASSMRAYREMLHAAASKRGVDVGKTKYGARARRC